MDPALWAGHWRFCKYSTLESFFEKSLMLITFRTGFTRGIQYVQEEHQTYSGKNMLSGWKKRKEEKPRIDYATTVFTTVHYVLLPQSFSPFFSYRRTYAAKKKVFPFHRRSFGLVGNKGRRGSFWVGGGLF